MFDINCSMKLPSIQKLCHNILFLTIFAIESFLIASLNFFPDYRQFSRISRFFLVFTHMNEIPAVLAALVGTPNEKIGIRGFS